MAFRDLTFQNLSVGCPFEFENHLNLTFRANFRSPNWAEKKLVCLAKYYQ